MAKHAPCSRSSGDRAGAAIGARIPVAQGKGGLSREAVFEVDIAQLATFLDGKLPIDGVFEGVHRDIQTHLL